MYIFCSQQTLDALRDKAASAIAAERPPLVQCRFFPHLCSTKDAQPCRSAPCALAFLFRVVWTAPLEQCPRNTRCISTAYHEER